jgi:hypothetical protein
MSWSIKVSSERDVVGEELRAAIETVFDSPGWQDSEVRKECVEQAHAAAVAARTLLDAAVGTTSRVAVNISGHANPNHGVREGWSNEFITVSVNEIT